MLATVLAGLFLVFLINEIGITWYPPVWTSSDGRNGCYDPAGVRSCMGARALAVLADWSSTWQWHRCATTLYQAQALDAFNLRHWALISDSAFTLITAFGFALAVRFDRPPHRVMRGGNGQKASCRCGQTAPEPRQPNDSERVVDIPGAYACGRHTGRGVGQPDQHAVLDF
jgi:hypothetical protein